MRAETLLKLHRRIPLLKCAWWVWMPKAISKLTWLTFLKSQLDSQFSHFDQLLAPNFGKFNKASMLVDFVKEWAVEYHWVSFDKLLTDTNPLTTHVYSGRGYTLWISMYPIHQIPSTESQQHFPEPFQHDHLIICCATFYPLLHRSFFNDPNELGFREGTTGWFALEFMYLGKLW